MSGVIAPLLLGVALLLDAEVPEPPRVEMITEEVGKAKTGGPAIRGYWEDGVMYLTEGQEDQLELSFTIAHELVHHVQASQGKMKLMGKKSLAACEEWYANEMEALDVEDRLREAAGLDKTERLVYSLAKISCMGAD